MKTFAGISDQITIGDLVSIDNCNLRVKKTTDRAIGLDAGKFIRWIPKSILSVYEAFNDDINGNVYKCTLPNWF